MEVGGKTYLHNPNIMLWNQNSGYGQAMLSMVSSEVPVFGNVHVVFNLANSDEKNYQHMQDIMDVDPDGNVRFFTSLKAAYDACEDNNNDVIVLDGNSSHVLAEGLAWEKSRIHLIGFDGGHRLIQQGSKIQSTDGVGDAYVVKVTGTRNSFINIKAIQVDTTATSLTCWQMGGEGNLYKNFSAVFGVVDNLGDAAASEVVCGEDSGTFIDCEFGTETLLTSAARTVFLVDQVTAGQEFKSNRFLRPTFVISSSDADALLFSLAAKGDILFTNLMRDPVFMASVDSAGGAALTIAVKSVSGVVKGTVNFGAPQVYNCGSFSTTSDGFQVALTPTSTTNAFEGKTPA